MHKFYVIKDVSATLKERGYTSSLVGPKYIRPYCTARTIDLGGPYSLLVKAVRGSEDVAVADDDAAAPRDAHSFAVLPILEHLLHLSSGKV